MYTEQLFDPRTSLLVDLHCSDTESPRMFVFGEVDALTAGQLQKAVVDVLRRQRPSRIEVDVHGVSFVDSAGIRALVLCKADARRVDCQLTLTNPQPVVYRVLQITGLLEHFGLTTPPPSNAASRVDRCGVMTSLTTIEAAKLRGISSEVPVVQALLRCEIAAGHDGSHVTFATTTDDGELWWWFCWGGQTREVRQIDTCDARWLDDPYLEDCLLPDGHPGQHSFELQDG